MEIPRPRIGITTGIAMTTTNDEIRTTYTVPSDYIRAVSAAGGLPLLLPPENVHIDAFLTLLDGLVFIGGADIDPARYGDETHPATAGVNGDLDDFEIDLLQRAWERDVPTLCICRGIQILNVARGGTLIQDLPDQAPSGIGHQQRHEGKKRGDIGHRVRLTDGENPLRQIMGTDAPEVNTFHHQAIRDVAPGLHVLATAPDGVVEAVHDPTRTFLLGVQWHPEGMADDRAEELALFQELVAQAALYAAVAR